MRVVSLVHERVTWLATNNSMQLRFPSIACHTHSSIYGGEATGDWRGEGVMRGVACVGRVGTSGPPMLCSPMRRRRKFWFC